MSSRAYDIVVIGATGFTGKLVARYLSQKVGVRWVIAGRDLKKLEAVKSGLTIVTGGRAPDVSVVSLDDSASIDRLFSTALVVLTTVGPYALYGEPVLAGAIRNGCHYVDITGESHFVSAMLRKYEEEAKRKQVKVICQSGYDSIPSDLGTLFAVHELNARVPETRNAVHSVIGFINPMAEAPRTRTIGASGGTLATVLAAVEAGIWKPEYQDPYLLVPAESRPPKVRPSDADIMLPEYSPELGGWVAPFLLSSSNSKIVRRSAALYQRAGKAYGSNFGFREGYPSFSRFSAWLLVVAVACFFLSILIPPTRWFLRRFILPKPGDGTPEELRKQIKFKNVLYAKSENGGHWLKASVTGGDPGYDETSKMISEAAILLVEDAKGSGASPGASGPAGLNEYGFLTPAAAFGYRLINRLNALGIKFQVLEFK